MHNLIEKPEGISMEHARELIGARYAYRQGFYGDGIGVAVLDSGLNVSHPDLCGRVVYAYNYLNGTKDITDDCGHGTHVTGIIGGTGVASGGRYQGLAPRCHFLSFKVLDREGNGNSGSVIQALQWLIDHGKEYDLRIINISVGSRIEEATGRTELIRAVEEAWDAGFVICAAAGNEGPNRSSITSPGTSPRIITVGASDDNLAASFMGSQKKNYSGRGPTLDCVCKPDVVAPGSNLISCNADWNRTGKKMYTAKSGTSMATPIVSGSIALLLSKERQLTNKDVKLRLWNTCKDLGRPRNQQGWGRIDIVRLLDGRNIKWQNNVVKK